MNLTMRLYRRLARAFPHEFQIVYGADVVQLGDDVIREIWRAHGILGLMRLIVDLALRIPMEYGSEMRRDLVYSIRLLAQSPGFALVAIVSMGLGIGITTAEFSGPNTLVLKDMPGARDPRQLVITQAPVSYPDFEQYRDHHDLFLGAAAFIQNVPFAVTLDQAGAGRVFGHIVSPEYFDVIGVRAAQGRVFGPETDRPGETPVAFVSDRFWRDRLHADPGAIGRILRINGQSVTIVGIGPKDFLGAVPLLAADLFIPSTVAASVAPELSDDILHKREAKAFWVLLRLAPDVTLKSAEEALDTITRHLDEAGFDAERNRKGRRVTLLPGGGIMPLPVQFRFMLITFAGVLMGLIMTIACMNLANMLLARAAARRREIAIRLAVGASRFRLIRQLLTESVLLSLCGGAAGFPLAYWLTSLTLHMKLPFSTPLNFDIRPDLHVLLFTLAISVIAGLGFGLVPALAATRADVATTLKGGDSGLPAYRRFGLRNLLVVYQVAGSLALLLITGFIVIGVATSSAAKVPFDANTMVLFSLDPVRDGYSREQATALFEKLPDRLRKVGAVEHVALAELAPFTTVVGAQNVTAPAREGSSTVLRGVSKQKVGAGYFAALSMRILAGREFEDRGQRGEPSKSSALPLILNETSAHGLFGKADPLGKRITDGGQSYEVVGLVPDLVTGLPGTAVTNAILYVPVTRPSHLSGDGMTVMIRSTSVPDAMAGVRKELAAIDPNLNIFNLRTLEEALDQVNGYTRIAVFTYGGIGIFGLILASIGLAGVTAYSVARRRKEIGIRMALGARRGQVLGLVLKEGFGLVAAGSVIGFGVAFAASKALAGITSIFTDAFKVGTSDPRLIVGAPLLLTALAMLACYIPARKSTRIDPVTALREE